MSRGVGGSAVTRTPAESRRVADTLCPERSSMKPSSLLTRTS